jgi:hypothetical protein
MLKVIGTALLTAVLTSAFWVWFYNFVPGAAAADREVTAVGEKITIDPKAQPPVTLAEGIWVGPAGLAIPVQGVRPKQLSDTFTQARAGGARTHDAIDIMAESRSCSSAREAAESPSMSVRPTSAGPIITRTFSRTRRVWPKGSG